MLFILFLGVIYTLSYFFFNVLNAVLIIIEKIIIYGRIISFLNAIFYFVNFEFNIEIFYEKFFCNYQILSNIN